LPKNLFISHLNCGRVRSNLPFFKRFICNPRVFIDKKYKRPIVDQWVVINLGCLSFPPYFALIGQ